MNDQAPRHIRPVTRRESTGLVASVYGQMAREFAVVPPMTIHSVVPDILAGLWSVSREALIVGRAGRARREMVAAAVSRINTCPYCVEVHGTMLHATNDHLLAKKLQSDEGAAEAAGVEPLIDWALSTRSPLAPILTQPPFGEAEAPQILGTAVAFHFINRMVNIFLDPSPLPKSVQAPGLKSLLRRLFGATVGKHLLRVNAKPGRSLELLPDADLPRQFRWAMSNPFVAGALARMADAIDRHGKRCMSEGAIETVSARVRKWSGEDPGLGTAWLDEGLAPLSSDKERVAARLASLAALASYRVDEPLIAAFRAHFPDDRDLIATAAWGSFEAVKRLSEWIGGPYAATEPNLSVNDCLPV